MNRLLCIISDTKLFFFVDAPRPNKGLELQTIKGCYEIDISMYINSKEQFKKEVWQDLCESAGYMSSTYIAALYLYNASCSTIFPFCIQYSQSLHISSSLSL